MPTHIALVANQKEDVEVYLDHLDKAGVTVKVVPSFTQLEQLLSTRPHNGIIVDLKTKLGVPREQKELAYELLDHYPVLQSRIIPGSNKMQTIPFGKTGRDISLETFLAEECPGFNARTMRSSTRRSIHFNILLSREGSFSMDDMERTVSINASKDGMFILTTSKWSRHASVAFIIRDLAVKTPVVGEIRWCTPWGRQMKLPGIGVKFEDIQLRQRNELIDKYNLN
jgi:hypothetical protein